MTLDFDTIIIGGGLGGLTAGATLAKSGKKVLLLEQHYIPGGCATAFKRKKFVMEVGLHEMDGLFEKDYKQAIFKFLEVDKHIEFIKIPEFFRFKGKTIDWIHPHGDQATAQSLIAMYPNEEKGIRAFLKLMNGVLTEIPKFPLEKWKQRLMLPIMPLTFPHIVKASRKSLGHWLHAHIKNEDLKLIFQSNLLYYHDDPYTMSMTYYSAAQSSYINGGGHFIKGGSQKLSNYLTQVIEHHHGQVLLGKQVSAILVEKGKACGVIFKDSFNESMKETKITAHTIIANAAIPLVKNMLPQTARKKIAHKIDHLKPACSLLSIYIGFKKELKELGNQHYSTFILGDDVQSIDDILKNNQGDWSRKGFVFVDYSQIDSQLAPKGKSVGVVCAADYLSDWNQLDMEAYKAKKEKVAQLFFKRLEKIIPGITEQIEYYEVGTSKTVQRYTLNPEGTPYGYAQTLEQSGMGRIPFQSPIKNLYFAGAWTFPGGGFTGAIISGFLCANTVNKSFSKKNKTDAMQIEDSRVVKLISNTQIVKNTIELTFDKPKAFEYQAGQYAVLNILNPKHETLDIPIRPLSMVSHPDENVLRFAMRVSDSNYKKSVKEMKLGSACRIFGPMGHFSIATKSKSIAFLISGIGITPILPLLKELERTQFDKLVYLFYSNHSKETAAYHEYLQSSTFQSFRYVPIFTKTEARLNESLLRKELKTLEEYDYYLVGRNDFIESMKNILHNNHVDKKNINIDDFG